MSSADANASNGLNVHRAADAGGSSPKCWGVELLGRMDTYRESGGNLWNVYFMQDARDSKRNLVGGAIAGLSHTLVGNRLVLSILCR
jgi:hypothetical protein